jgi:hypothetical protein
LGCVEATAVSSYQIVWHGKNCGKYSNVGKISSPDILRPSLDILKFLMEFPIGRGNGNNKFTQFVLYKTLSGCVRTVDFNGKLLQ